jgi:CelD/BcsL family acetyltransferase involved in cellulose biosynthesis
MLGPKRESLMKIKEINDYQDFLALKDEWANLLEKCQLSVFSTWEWLSTWWKNFGGDKRLVLLLAIDNDRIIGIAPLMYSARKIFGLRRGKISFIGIPHTDYHDFIIANKIEKCLQLFIDYLKQLPEKWNYLELSEIPENSKSIPILTKLSKTLKPFTRCPYKPLPESRDAFWNSLGSDMRRNLRRYIKKTKKEFHVEFADYSDSQLCTEGMHWLFELHQKRWRSKGLSGAFADEKVRNFHLEVAKIFARRMQLRLFLLKLSNKPVAAIYGFKDKKRFYLYLSGFDPEYSQYRVGNQIIAYTMEKCIEEGLSEFDFMRGGETYKGFWKTLSRWNYTAIITRDIFSTASHWLYTKILSKLNL